MALEVLSYLVVALGAGSLAVAAFGALNRRVTLSLNTASFTASLAKNPVAFVVAELLYIVGGIFLIWVGAS
jgi:hypothetical protein